jgi:hypothetical protein
MWSGTTTGREAEGAEGVEGAGGTMRGVAGEAKGAGEERGAREAREAKVGRELRMAREAQMAVWAVIIARMGKVEKMEKKTAEMQKEETGNGELEKGKLGKGEEKAEAEEGEAGWSLCIASGRKTWTTFLGGMRVTSSFHLVNAE